MLSFCQLFSDVLAFPPNCGLKLDKLHVVAVLDIDVVGIFTMSQAALKYLREGGIGKPPSEAGIILNLSATIQYLSFLVSNSCLCCKGSFLIIILNGQIMEYV